MSDNGLEYRDGTLTKTAQASSELRWRRSATTTASVDVLQQRFHIRTHNGNDNTGTQSFEWRDVPVFIDQKQTKE